MHTESRRQDSNHRYPSIGRALQYSFEIKISEGWVTNITQPKFINAKIYVKSILTILESQGRTFLFLKCIILQTLGAALHSRSEYSNCDNPELAFATLSSRNAFLQPAYFSFFVKSHHYDSLLLFVRQPFRTISIQNHWNDRNISWKHRK